MREVSKDASRGTSESGSDEDDTSSATSDQDEEMKDDAQPTSTAKHVDFGKVKLPLGMQTFSAMSFILQRECGLIVY